MGAEQASAGRRVLGVGTEPSIKRLVPAQPFGDASIDRSMSLIPDPTMIPDPTIARYRDADGRSRGVLFDRDWGVWLVARHEEVRELLS
jgi:hypothetical protein